MYYIKSKQFIFCSVLVLFYINNVFAESVKQDNVHVRNWNNFADNLYAFHKLQIANKKITVKSKKGGYFGNKDFYLEKEYIDEHGKVLSRIAWETKNPQTIHVIELFIYDNKNRIIRDYSAAYLPDYRNAPVQTLISLHQYNSNLHAFRSFDASGDRILERCEGDYVDSNQQTKKVSFMFDEDELYELVGNEKGFMVTKDYKACFNTLSESLGRFIKP